MIMMKPSSIHPDVELRDYLKDTIDVVVSGGATEKVTVYGDWEKPTNDIPDDFVIIMNNGSPGGVGVETPYAEGYVMVSLYCKLNDDGTVKKNRVKKILEQFDETVNNLLTDNYFFKYPRDQYITPTTPNVTSGYSVTTLNLMWHTKNDFNS